MKKGNAAADSSGKWHRIRSEEFPAAGESTYLNHAASSPLPRRSVQALRRYAALRERPYKLYQDGTEEYDAEPLRKRTALLLHCEPSEIGFVPSTSDGMAMAVNAIEWKPAHNLILARGEYPGVVYGCQNMAARGIDVRHVACRPGRIDVEEVMESVDANTRAIAISHVHWISGYKAAVGRLGRFCRDRDIVLIVDAIQSMGIQQVDVGEMKVDVLVAGTFKWLMGIPGIAVLYVNRETMPKLHPDRAGWMSMKTMKARPPEMPWHDDALRFATGSWSDCALMVLERSLELILEADVAAIQARAVTLIDRLSDGLLDLGFSVNSCLDDPHRSSILNFSAGSSERNQTLHQRLLKQGIIVSLRGGNIRVAPHFYNTEDEIDILLEACRAFRDK